MSLSQRKPTVLLTEIGGTSTGDELLYHATARRFVAQGWAVSPLCRVRPRAPQTLALVSAIHELVVDDHFLLIPSVPALLGKFSRRHPAAYRLTRELVAAHDLVAVCPGGRFTAGYNNPRALLTAAVALELGKPVVQLHQSFGPLKRRHARMVAEVLSRSLVTLVRDDRSHDFVSRMDVPDGKLVATRDVAFAEQLGERGDARHDIGINIRCGHNGHVRPTLLRRFLDDLHATRPGLSVLLYSTTHPIAPDLLRAAEGHAEIVAGPPPFHDALALPSACRINLSDSYHGVIFSMMAGRPVVPCQPDFASWKIHGTCTPGVPDFDVLPAFDSLSGLTRLLSRTFALLDDPQPTLAEQSRRLAHGRELAETGWRELFQRLETVRAGVSNL